MSEVSAGRPSSRLPLQVLTSGQARDPARDQCSFHVPARAGSLEPGRVMGLGAPGPGLRGGVEESFRLPSTTPTHASPPRSTREQAGSGHQRPGAQLDPQTGSGEDRAQGIPFGGKFCVECKN